MSLKDSYHLSIANYRSIALNNSNAISKLDYKENNNRIYKDRETLIRKFYKRLTSVFVINSALRNQIFDHDHDYDAYDLKIKHINSMSNM